VHDFAAFAAGPSHHKVELKMQSEELYIKSSDECELYTVKCVEGAEVTEKATWIQTSLSNALSMAHLPPAKHSSHRLCIQGFATILGNTSKPFHTGAHEHQYGTLQLMISHVRVVSLLPKLASVYLLFNHSNHKHTLANFGSNCSSDDVTTGSATDIIYVLLFLEVLVRQA
jgi:hypothetical protein